MSTQRRLALLIAVFLSGPMACSEEPVAPKAVLDEPGGVTVPGHDLELTLPLPERAANAGPSARADEPMPADLPEEYDLEAALISKATSSPYVAYGRAGNQAKTTFTGNRIKVDVYTTVTFLAEPLVTEFLQTTQDSYFWPQTEKRHDAFSQIAIEGSCGHTASGRAQHVVWIDYGPYEWGETERPSNGKPYSQRDCETDDAPVDDPRTGSGGDEPPPGEIYTCWYRYTYDIYTGEVLEFELLYCETT
ncbi:MAG: hypothetical protein P8170_03275 [Gemmatimonadota bacterium]|jgi:hypothetical protein